MRIPLTGYGLPQVVVFPAAVIGIMAAVGLAVLFFLPLQAGYWIEAVLTIVLIWVFAFFRDPQRAVPTDGNVLLAPADGTIADIEKVDEKEFIAGPALRVGIFLSIFNVHINRSPCNARVEKITYRRGKYINAMNPQAGRVNESNDLALVRMDEPQDRLIVRQISGAIARRIVCAATEGKSLACGEKFGMIKFGSRTELYVPVRENARCLVQVGAKVKAGLTPILRYE
jgi:phosphatidylserine decarboxylase